MVLSVSKGAAAARPDSGIELDSGVHLKVQVQPAEQHASMASPALGPEVLIGLKEGDRRLIIFDEKQNLVSTLLPYIPWLPLLSLMALVHACMLRSRWAVAACTSPAYAGSLAQGSYLGSQ